MVRTSSNNNDVFWVLTDHLGSASVTLNHTGVSVGEMRYFPYGETRFSTGTQPTERHYTGQYASDVGLYYYNARWYNPYINRFVSADSIVPQMGHPQTLNRFTYSLNNPIRLVDPTGHTTICGVNCDEGTFSTGVGIDWLQYLLQYGVKLVGKWTTRNILLAATAVGDVGLKFSSIIGGTAQQAFSAVYGTSSENPMVLFWGNSQTDELNATKRYLSTECTGIGGGGCTSSSKLINFMSLSEHGGNRTAAMASTNARNNIVHELGHAFGNRFRDNTGGPYDAMDEKANASLISDDGFYPSPASARLTWRQHPLSMGGGDPGNEAFADMFLGWTYGKWGADRLGSNRAAFMTTNMSEWVTRFATD